MARERDRGQSDQGNGNRATPAQGRAAAQAADAAQDPASVHANDARPPRDKLRVEPPSLSLPKGGGALKSIDETYSTSPSTGTSSLAIPLPLTADRTGAAPAIGLRYDSGIGNSVVGLGWSLDLPSIRCRTDHQLPRYRGTDVYLLHGAEELVVVSTWDGSAWHNARGPVGAYTVTRYRPRIEAAFARIERIDHATLGSWWRVTSRDNVTTFYGLDDGSRIFDPANPAHVFQWLPVLSFDDKGNCTVYEYKLEDLVSVPPSRADANRRSGLAAYTNRHLKRVHYGNRTPYAVDPEDPYRPAVPATGAPRTFLFHAVIDYGEHDPLAPELAEAPDRAWLARPDPFSTYRSGFDVRTSRLVQRVLVFHEFDELDGGAPSLVRSLDLAYASSGAASPQATEVSYLASITQCGYARGADGSYARRALPPLELAYQPLAWNTEIQTVDRASLANLPAGATTGYDWLDLDGEGIAGLFTEQANGWFYKANLGDTDEDGRVQLDAARLVAPRPSVLGMATGSLHLADLDGNGLQQIVVHTPQLQGYFDRGIHGEFLPFRPFPSMVRIDLDDKNLRMLDLDGDGRADLLISEDDALVWYHGDKRGYQPRERVPRSHDQERGPAIVFAEELQTIFLADMTGDGLV
ncbi:MAG TPA: SpvB/TcaC N-terminal domain-containing protein, partial [Kofleriaceae bacterium]|nr:SpvB/TcaC N-terminal domain-containing protein [Kofleriaceae bacterium]